MKISCRLVFLMIYFCSVWGQKCSEGTTCTDEDECLTKPCGPYTVCHNTPGSFYCTCKNGFYSESADKQFAGSAMSFCKDYNECSTIPTVCGNDATCRNTMGGFYCLCNKGFARVSGETSFTGYGKGCEDIDECLGAPCGPHAICINTAGSFICTSKAGFTFPSTVNNLAPGPFLKCLSGLMDPSIIERCYSQNLQQITTDRLCSPINSTLTFVESMCQLTKDTSAKKEHDVFNEITSFGNRFVAEGSRMENTEKEQKLQSTSLFLEVMESVTLATALVSASQGTKSISTTHLDLDVRVIQGNGFRLRSRIPDRITLRAKENTMDVYLRTVTEGQSSGRGVVAFISYGELDSLQSGDFVEKDRSRPYQMTSGVVSATISNRNRHELSERVNITLKHTKEPKADGRRVCVYWNRTRGASYWSPKGCEVMKSNKTHTTCGCQHLSSFAILMTTVEDDWDQSLSVITFFGIITSLVCLGLAIVTFLFVTPVTSHNTTIHINLCVTLFLAELLFLVGISRTSNKVGCGVIAGCLHYLFLAAFAWMCVEGLQLHLMVRNLQKINDSCVRKVMRGLMYPFGYGVPVVIVTISVATNPAGYGSPQYCWLQIEKGFIWSFVGPVCAMILFNTVLFAVTLWILRSQLTRLNSEVTKIKDMRMLTFKAIAQVFILGCTWILGLFHFQDDTMAMAYLFTIVNSFQGTFIFIILCVLNRQVRDGYRTWVNGMCMIRKKASFSDSGSTILPMTIASEKA
ncbi:adhesion G protein-coupled receptor E2-like [Heptranchias perlo]|uniref:adhesion G protein-coupled receptor E2-like n=1 Tax=Heptranchias perlo TaxID=212740 RepID=UPI003559F1C6